MALFILKFPPFIRIFFVWLHPIFIIFLKVVVRKTGFGKKSFLMILRLEMMVLFVFYKITNIIYHEKKFKAYKNNF